AKGGTVPPYLAVAAWVPPLYPLPFWHAGRDLSCNRLVLKRLRRRTSVPGGTPVGTLVAAAAPSGPRRPPGGGRRGRPSCPCPTSPWSLHYDKHFRSATRRRADAVRQSRDRRLLRQSGVASCSLWGSKCNKSSSCKSSTATR